MTQKQVKLPDTLDKRPGGRVQVELVDSEGNVEVVAKKNLALNALYEHIINCLRDGVQIDKQIQYIAVGTGGHSAGDTKTPIPPEASDTALDEEINPPGKKDIVERNSATPYEVEFVTTFFKDEANDVITEAGLFLDDNTLVNRVTFSSFEKNNLVIMIVRWFLFYTI